MLNSWWRQSLLGLVFLALVGSLTFLVFSPAEAEPASQGPAPGGTLSGQAVGSVAGCPVFPADNIWNTPVDTLPVDGNSAAYVATIGADRSVHPDFGSGTWDGGPIGIPYVDVPVTQPRVTISFDYADESDPGPYPVPPDAPIEGGPDGDGDRHVLVVKRDNCILYEMFYAFPQPHGNWQAGSGAVFRLYSNALRPAGWTSADAAGLPMLAGLVRYDEVAQGAIRHALRFTAPQTRRAYVWPGRHYASTLTGTQYPPMGQRFRLRADFDISSFSPPVQIILRALKKYGMMLADNGSPWFISGAPDERWNNDVLHELHRVHGSDFEAVDVSSLMVDPDSGQVRCSTTPTPTPTYPACFLTGTVRDQSGTYYLEEAGRLVALLYGSLDFPAYLGQRVTVGGPCRVWQESAGPRPVFLAQTIMLANQPARPAAKTAKEATGVW